VELALAREGQMRKLLDFSMMRRRRRKRKWGCQACEGRVGFT
jgi:hypothetical protein